MGLDAAAVKFLCAARSMGVDFAATATIGRQSFFPGPAALALALRALGASADAQRLGTAPYAEPFFELLGAKSVESVDASRYEGATHIHDMNHPLPASLRGRFTVVYDGGTLEHVFDAPRALRNCMEMVRVGGHFLQATVANNYMGHGFWQFSPELLFRALSAENGFEARAVLLHESLAGGGSRWYAVADPAAVGRRVQLCNDVPTYLFAIARRVADVEVFAKPPQQSDYVASWSGAGGASAAPANAAPPSPSPGIARRLVPAFARRAMRRLVGRAPDPTCFRRVAEEQLLRGEVARVT